MAPRDDMWVRRFVVSDPVKHKKGFTLYKITSVVFPKKHPEAVTKIVVWKRYNDFKKLHKELKLKYQKLQLPDKFPPFVKAKFFKRFEDDVIEERRQAALVLLEFVAQHSSLFTSDVFVKFFQCGYSVNSTTGSIEKIEPCQNGIFQPFPVDSSWSPTFQKRENLDPIPIISSEDDVTSFTTDTDSAISSPLQSSVDFSWPVVDGDSSDKEHHVKNRFDFTVTGHDIQETANKRDIQKKTCESLTKPGKSNYKVVPHYKTRSKEVPLSVLWKPIDDLQYFKVLGVYAKVMLVIDTRDDSLHVVKALQKTPCPIFKKQSTIFPRQIPYMVELHGIFETSTAIYLVVEHISSGKLWDYATPYFPNNLPKSSGGNTNRQELKNIDYYGDDDDDDDTGGGKGRKSSSSNCSISTNLTTTLNCSQSSLSSENENSYLELIREYTSGERLNFNSSPKKKNNNENSNVNNSLSSENIPAENLYEKILNYSKSEGSLNVCDDDLVCNFSSDITLFNLVAERLESGRTCYDLIKKWKNLDEFNECDLSNSVKVETKLNKSIKVDESSSKNDIVVNKSNSMNKLSINKSRDNLISDIPDVQIDNLVENARKLLQSVDETLLKSDSLVSRLDVCVKSDDVIDDIMKNSRYLSNDSDFSKRFINRISTNNLISRNSILLKTEEVDGNSSSPDSRISKSPAHSLCRYDTTKLHPPSPYSRASSPVSSVSTDGEAQWWKQEIEGNGLKEETVKKWAAQLLIAINALHNVGIICRDLNPDNILVHDGSIRLTYFCQFAGVEPPVDYKAVKKLYCAPEVSSIFPITESADWWSYGAILYELITGQSLISCHPGGIHCHTILYVPEGVSIESQSLLKGLLQFNPSERLCSGTAGVEEIKCHPFFMGIDWKKVYEDGLPIIK
ncbi:ribosomal protein S6 kinase delta-1 [Lycorma delicatula]|uniref:ribosomal protein S6 kinase delta-1 n=1 Tax=Lycorma delicatula TaxID=130591 RepID=UPI003F5144BA